MRVKGEGDMETNSIDVYSLNRSNSQESITLLIIIIDVHNNIISVHPDAKWTYVCQNVRA